MIRIIDARTEDPFVALKSRTAGRDETEAATVAAIIDDVRRRGDEALLENARKFDAPELTDIRVSEAEMAEATLPPDQAKALEVAADRIFDFHNKQYDRLIAGPEPTEVALQGMHGAEEDHLVFVRSREWWATDRLGGRLGQRLVPVDTVGAYVPGGRANYPSSVLMNVLPARAALVRNAVVTTPADRDGKLSPAVLVALRTVRFSKEFRAFKIGGAAAIAALALGTESVPRVDKIVGPGNRFVNEAKRQLWGAVGLDGYAGPSEVCILADETSNAKFAAADLLTQIEHAPDNCAFLVCSEEAKLREILAEVDRQATGAPREQILRQALAGESIAFLARDGIQAIDIVNAVAPEHLGIITRDPESDMSRIRNAGCILLGEWSPEAAGDFCAGPSHTLPTSGAARFGSPVNILDFLKVQSLIRMTREELQELTPIIHTFAEMEGFPTHGQGASVRFE
jgi:histidinol dehydrogenase